MMNVVSVLVFLVVAGGGGMAGFLLGRRPT